MASTRDKRLKTDSPTPVQPNEIVAPTTPSTKSTTAIKLKRMSRNRSGILSVKTENEDGNDSVGLSEDTQSSTASIDAATVPKTPNTRPKRQPVKDEKEEESNGDTKEAEDSPAAMDSPKDPNTPRTRKLTKAQLMKKKAVDLAIARRQAMMKRKSLPLPVKSSLRNIARRLSGGFKVGELAKEEAQAVAKKGKPGRKPAVVKKEEKEEEEEEEEIEAEPTVEEEAESVPEPEVELDKSEKSETTEKSEEMNVTEEIITDVLKPEKISAADKAAAAMAAIDLQNVRRSTRQRKSTIKDRDSPFTGRRSQAREKSESKRDSISPALSTASIKAEKESSKAISITVEPTEVAEKDPSLSPELVSEEMDTESVQHLYDKPDFLENNLGIEQDPKLGEIVKVQEKTKVVESVIKSDEPLAADDVEMKDVEEETTEKVNGDAVEKKTAEPIAKEAKVEPEIKKEPVEETVEASLVEKSSDKDDESGEENKENNESSAKSIGSGSPRSEDRLKTVSEENVPKLDVDSESFKEKESHLLTLGLLTHKAAGEAKIAKQKRKEELAKSLLSQPAAGRSTKSKKDSSSDQQYTGTLKINIKLNRTEKEKRKTRMPLKMTFQKKNRDRDSNGSSNSSESFYTIQEVSRKAFPQLIILTNVVIAFIHRRRPTQQRVTVR